MDYVTKGKWSFRKETESQDLELCKVLRFDTKTQSIKGRIENWVSSKLKTFLCGRHSYEDEKISYRVREDICKHHLQQRTSTWKDIQHY